MTLFAVDKLVRLPEEQCRRIYGYGVSTYDFSALEGILQCIHWIMDENTTEYGELALPTRVIPCVTFS